MGEAAHGGGGCRGSLGEIAAAPVKVAMAGLVLAIHVFNVRHDKTWMPGTRPGMTTA